MKEFLDKKFEGVEMKRHVDVGITNVKTG